jgi:hypothetical protein
VLAVDPVTRQDFKMAMKIVSPSPKASFLPRNWNVVSKKYSHREHN